MNFLHYLVQVNLYLVLFYGFYRLLLFNETFYNLNRSFLVGSAVLSFGIPFWYSDYVQSFFITQQVNEVFYTVLSPAIFSVQANAENPFTWYDLLKICYGICTAFLTMKLIFNLLQLKKLLKNTDSHRNHGVGYSFFNFVFVDKDLQKREVVLEHEYVHIRQLHSADVILFEVIGVLCWFNPVVYFYKKSIKNIHEFIADDIASRFEPSKADYAMLLFSQQFGLNPHQLTNQFLNQSTLKRRIEMLQKPRSRKIALLKYGFTAPLFALMLVIASASIAKNKEIKKAEKLVVIAAEMPVKVLLENPLQEKITSDDNIITGNITAKEDGKPLPGVVIKVVGKNETTTTDVNGNYRVNALPNDELTFSFIGFEMNTVPITDKKTINVSLKSDNNPNLPSSTENNAIISNSLAEVVVTGYAKNGKPINEEIFTTVEENPRYPGGIKEMYRFIGQNIKYPAAAQKANTQGKVFVKFIVRKDGSTSDMTVLKGIGNGCDEETVRVIGMMPKWNAGKQNGVPVNVYFTMPVSFVLEGNTNIENKLTDEAKSEIPKSKVIDNDKITIKGQGKTDSYSINGPFNSDDALWVIDGVIAYNDAMKKVNPEDIESISILKNTNATALYGERGKNGVIIVTTKKTKEETNFTIKGKQLYTIKVGKNRQIINAKTANEYPTDRIMQMNVVKLNDIKARKTPLNEYEEKVLKEGYDGWVDIWVREQ